MELIPAIIVVTLVVAVIAWAFLHEKAKPRELNTNIRARETGRIYIGEETSYPAWTHGDGRWFIRPWTEDRPFVWAPGHGDMLRNLAARANSAHEAARARDELAQLLLECLKCWLRGYNPKVQAESDRPEQWSVTSPCCREEVVPFLANLDAEVIINRWRSLGQPTVHHPVASARQRRVRPISDLAEWIGEYEPDSLELAYVGQQLWSSLSGLLNEAGVAQPSVDPDMDWWQFDGLLTVEEAKISVQAGELPERQGNAAKLWLRAVKEGKSLKEMCREAGEDYRAIAASWRAARARLRRLYEE